MPEQPVSIQLTALNRNGARVNAYPITIPGNIAGFDNAVASALPPATESTIGAVTIGNNVHVSNGTISVLLAQMGEDSSGGIVSPWRPGLVYVTDDERNTEATVGYEPIVPTIECMLGHVSLAIRTAFTDGTHLATTAAPGLVQIGDNLTVQAGTLSVPYASELEPGVVKVENTSLIAIPTAGYSSWRYESQGFKLHRSELIYVRYHEDPTVENDWCFKNPETGRCVWTDGEPIEGSMVFADPQLTEEVDDVDVMMLDSEMRGLLMQAGATKTSLGIVQIGDNITVNAGTISVSEADDSTRGVVFLENGEVDTSRPSNVAAPSVAFMDRYIHVVLQESTATTISVSTANLFPTCHAVQQYVASKIPNTPSYAGARLTTLVSGTPIWVQGEQITQVQPNRIDSDPEGEPTNQYYVMALTDRLLYIPEAEVARAPYTTTFIFDTYQFDGALGELDAGLRFRTATAHSKVNIRYWSDAASSTDPLDSNFPVWWADMDIPPHYAPDNPAPSFDKADTIYMIRLHWDSIDRVLLANAAYTKERTAE